MDCIRQCLRRIALALLIIAPCAVALTASADTPNSSGRADPKAWPQLSAVTPADALLESRIDGLLAAMSLREKVGQLIEADITRIRPEQLRDYPLGALLAGGDSQPPHAREARAARLIATLGARPSWLSAFGRKLEPSGAAADAASWLAMTRAYHAVALERHAEHEAIPLLFGIDAVHGNAHVLGATVFPHAIGLGAAHDPQLIERVGAATAQESAAIGIDWTFAPMVAVPQDLRWGRSYEAYSQDPALVSRYAAAMVRGLQGDAYEGSGVPAGHVAATAKHFLADGATHLGIDEGDAQLDEQTLIATHAQGYFAALEANVMTVMASYSSWQGHKMHGNESLLTDVLKRRLGFRGFVVGDWNGHGQLAGCSNASCPAAINAGVDMLMAPDDWRALFDHTLAQVRSGEISQSRLNDAVRRILRVKLELGLFQNARPLEGQLDALGSSEHRALARAAVRESLVLLKNEDAVLPLRPAMHVLVAGHGANDIGRQCGGWTLYWQGVVARNGDFPQGESIFDGLARALRAGGGSAELSADGHYTQRPDAAIVVYGERPYAEWFGDLRSLDFVDDHTVTLLRRLRAQHIPVVSVFLSGRPRGVDAELAASDAFVAAWLPGSEGAGIADLLIGDPTGAARYDFTGRLPFAWPATRRAADTEQTDRRLTRFDVGYGLSYGKPSL